MSFFELIFPNADFDDLSTETYSEPSQPSQMELFVKIYNFCLRRLTGF